MPRPGIHLDTSEWDRSFRALPLQMAAGLTAITERIATESQDSMRSNAPWTDRTGNARGGLFAKAEHGLESHAVILYHTVDYGIWLEVKNSGQLAIIEPTLPVEGQRAMMLVHGLLGRLGALA